MSIPDPSLWRDMLAYLRDHHGGICRRWFEELEPLELDGGVLNIRVNNVVQQNYLSRQCISQFNEAAQNVTGALLAVRFMDGEVLSKDSKPIRSKKDRPAMFNGFEDQINLSPDYTFENFVTGPGNRLACAAAIAVSKQPGKAYNPMFIHGGVGLGKTHLLQAICQTVLNENPDTRICYLSCDTFVNQFLECVSSGQMNQFRHRYRHVDLLVIDDIHFLANRERTQEEFFHTFNTIHQSGRQIVLSCDSPPDEIPQLEDRLVSRFNWGLVTRIDKPCYETRVAIIKSKSKMRGLDLDDDVACYIATRFESNTRELEGAIIKVQSLAILRGVPIDLSLAQQALGDEQPTTSPQLSIQNIIDAVTTFYGVKLSDLQSKRRHRSITVPRQVCMFLARKRTRYSLEEIGGYFGGRDHTTVLHSIRTTEDRISVEPDFAQQIEHINTQLTGN